MSRHWGSTDPSHVRVSRLIDRTEVLGPGARFVVVVQGCNLRCRGCVAEATHPLDAGFELGVEELFARIAGTPGVAGVTFTGGEPFLQAPALSRLVDLLRAEEPELSTMSYSGYRLEWLTGEGSDAQRSLLDRLDLLIDGPFVQRLHAPLRWRGSSNQRIHALTHRHRAELSGSADETAGMELSLDSERRLEWVGVPPVPDFAARLNALAAPPE